MPAVREGRLPVHDSETKTWRHLDVFQHEAYLTARVPRVRCPEHGVHLVAVPWARAQSGFTLLFEALVMALAKQMPVAAIGGLVGEHDTRLWRIVHHYVDDALERQDLSSVTRLGVDETSFRRGQDYVTVFADIDRRAAIFVTPGRDGATYERFVENLRAHRGEPEQITEVCQDLSEAFLSGALEHLPEAEITFDRYHVKAQLTKAVDEVRRAERAEHGDLLKRSRYLWLRNPTNLTDRQRDRLDELLRHPLKTARAYRWMLKFDHAYELPADEAEHYLRAWCRGAKRSRLGPIIGFARLVEGSTGWASSAGLSRGSPTAYSKASTASCRPPNAAHAATARPATTSRSSISPSASSTSSPTRNSEEPFVFAESREVQS